MAKFHIGEEMMGGIRLEELWCDVLGRGVRDVFGPVVLLTIRTLLATVSAISSRGQSCETSEHLLDSASVRASMTRMQQHSS